MLTTRKFQILVLAYTAINCAMFVIIGKKNGVSWKA